MQSAALAAEEGEELQPHHLPPDVAATIQWTTGPPGDPGLSDDAVDDAFIALGQLMKRAGKGLWRRVSLKDKDKEKDKNKDGNGEGGEGEGEGDDAKGKRKKGKKNTQEPTDQDTPVSEKLANPESNTSPDEVVPRPRRPLLDLTESLPLQSHEEEGRVWEEEISEDFRKRISGMIAISKSTESDLKDTQSSLVDKDAELPVVTSTVEATGAQKEKPRSPV